MATAADRVARRRARAREAGLCVVCCKASPDPGHSVCHPCSYAAAQRTTHRRTQRQKLAQLNEILKAHESAGDEAYANHRFSEAAMHYRDASVTQCPPADGLRIAEKLAYALALGRNPAAASPLFDGILAAHLQNPAERKKTVEILLQRARQLYIDARTEEALALIMQAIQVADASCNPDLCKLANGRMANYLLGLDRYEEAERYINAMGNVRDSDEASIRASYHTQRAILASAHGRAIEAFDHFEKAVRIAKEDADLFHLVSIWSVYGQHAAMLGNIELAKSCCERSLFVARQYHVAVLIPNVNLIYVGILTRSGRYGLAQEHLSEALSYDVNAPLIDVFVVQYGIPLALRLKDKKLLTRCARISAIDFAFRSGQPDLIGSVAAAFAQWYNMRGNVSKAEHLLHRAVRQVERIWDIWDLPLAVARYGSRADIPRARELLTRLSALPSSKVAQAFLLLFNGFVAQRAGQRPEMHHYASEAAKSFDMLGWYGYSDLARTLCHPLNAGVRPSMMEEPVSAMLPALTSREQQVAELVVRGHTNREIAERLSISKHTVESHVASIMGRLGIRSRHQLADNIRD